MNSNITNNCQWNENVIVVDADFIDKVAFDLTVNFERMLMLDCVALDGGVREGKNNVQVIFIYDKSKKEFDNFSPSLIKEELDGKAFTDNLGEFIISAYPVEDMIDKADFIAETSQIICSQKEVKRAMIVADDNEAYDKVRLALRRIDDEGKRITLFAMQPMQGGNFRQEILGYSLMSALGIKGDEIR